MGLHSTQQGITLTLFLMLKHQPQIKDQYFYGYQKNTLLEHAKLHTLTKVKVTALIMFTLMDGREVKILILI